jgi:F-type H+-transporting ATPase subunit a
MFFTGLLASGEDLIKHALEEPKDGSNGVWHLLEHGGIFPEGVSITLPGFDIPGIGHFQLTKFKVLILVAALVVFWLFNRLANRLTAKNMPQGRVDNMLEAMLVMVRDQIAKPNLGNKADQYLPFLWTLFPFLLVINLIGMLPAPVFGCANASIAVTAAWALYTFIFILINGVGSSGVLGYLKGFWIPIDVPVLGPVISCLLYVIEFAGVFLRIGVLALRLFANMLGGHITLSILLTFILMAAKVDMIHHIGISFTSIIGAFLLSFLELFVAFLQAFVFTILSAVFIGSAVHGHGDDHGHDHDDHSKPAHRHSKPHAIGT